jgi:hypothetical protein
MNPIHAPECNTTLGPPRGMTEDQCGSLPARHCHETGTFTTYWQPDDVERQAIASGGPVMLTLWSRAHPPVLLQAGIPVDNPPAVALTGREIIGILRQWHMANVGRRPELPDIERLKPIPLSFMLLAAQTERMMEQPGTTSFVPGDALIAAFYAFLHHPLDDDESSTVLCHDGKVALVASRPQQPA